MVQQKTRVDTNSSGVFCLRWTRIISAPASE